MDELTEHLVGPALNAGSRGMRRARRTFDETCEDFMERFRRLFWRTLGISLVALCVTLIGVAGNSQVTAGIGVLGWVVYVLYLHGILRTSVAAITRIVEAGTDITGSAAAAVLAKLGFGGVQDRNFRPNLQVIRDFMKGTLLVPAAFAIMGLFLAVFPYWLTFFVLIILQLPLIASITINAVTGEDAKQTLIAVQKWSTRVVKFGAVGLVFTFIFPAISKAIPLWGKQFDAWVANDNRSWSFAPLTIVAFFLVLCVVARLVAVWYGVSNKERAAVFKSVSNYSVPALFLTLVIMAFSGQFSYQDIRASGQRFVTGTTQPAVPAVQPTGTQPVDGAVHMDPPGSVPGHVATRATAAKAPSQALSEDLEVLNLLNQAE